MSLKKKTIHGVLWTFTDAILVKGLTFIAMLFLARWLGPSDFGLIGMIAVFIGVGTILVDSGLSSSLIRTKNADDRDFSTVFYMNMALSIVVYALLFFIAPFIAQFYEEEVLVVIIRVYCLSFIISAFSTVQLAILNKEMRFKQITLLNAPSTIIGVTVGLIMGYYNYGVWSIVVLYLTTQLMFTFLLWFTNSWKPSLTFSKEKLQYHYKFGYKLMLSGLLDIIFNNSYHILIGKFFPVQVLGHYERARRFNEYPAMTLTSIIDKVTYPMLAEIKEDTLKLSQIYKRLLRLTFFITAPLMLGAAAIAKPLFNLVLGDEWLPAVPYFQILSIASMLYPIHAFNINVLKVFGRSDLFLKLEIMKKAIVILAIIVGFQFGILGLVWSSVFTSFIALLINTYYSGRLINYYTKHQLMDMLPIFMLSGISFLIMYFVVAQLRNYSDSIQILAAMFSGILIYLLSNSFFAKSPLYDLITLIKNRKL